MKKYKLLSKKNPELNKYGTAKEIWEHAQELGYKGETIVKDGFEIPFGEDISLEPEYVKFQRSVRFSHWMWHLVDTLVKNDKGMANRVDAMEEIFESFRALREIGPIVISTAKEEFKFDSLADFVKRRQFFESQGLEEVKISFSKQEKD